MRGDQTGPPSSKLDTMPPQGLLEYAHDRENAAAMFDRLVKNNASGNGDYYRRKADEARADAGNAFKLAEERAS